MIHPYYCFLCSLRSVTLYFVLLMVEQSTHLMNKWPQSLHLMHFFFLFFYLLHFYLKTLNLQPTELFMNCFFPLHSLLVSL